METGSTKSTSTLEQFLQKHDLQILDPPRTTEEILEHYGVLGMRWGVRKDRSTGRKVGSPTKGTARAKRKASRQNGTKKSSSNSSPKKLTNEELQREVERLRLEAEYRRLTSTPSLKKQVTNDVTKMLSKVALANTERILNAVVQKQVNTFLKKYGITAPAPQQKPKKDKAK